MTAALRYIAYDSNCSAYENSRYFLSLRLIVSTHLVVNGSCRRSFSPTSSLINNLMRPSLLKKIISTQTVLTYAFSLQNKAFALFTWKR